MSIQTGALSSPSRVAAPAILRSAGMLGVATAASRVLGFCRDWLIAFLYGTSLPAQAFVVAFRIPNLLRTLVGEGAANSAFVPVFSRTLALEGRDSWRRLAQSVWTHLFFWFLLLSAVGAWAAPWAVRGIAPGFQEDPALWALTVKLTRILFPFVGLVGLAAFSMGLLNSMQHFMLPSMGPILLNVCMMTGLLLWRPDALGLAWGVVAGGLLQLGVQWPMLRRAGISLRFRLAAHPGLTQISRLLLPRMAGAAVYQASMLVDTIFASFSHWVGSGGVAALYFANRFLQLPLGLFGVSLAQASLPTMAGLVAAGDLATVKRTFALALKSSLLVAIPSSVGLIVMGYPIIHTLLEHGAFSSSATGMTVPALACYALGLSGLCAAKVLVNTLYAFQDTWTPVRSAAVALGINLILNFLLVGPLGLAGLALATSVSSSWNATHLYRAVRRRLGPLDSSPKGWLARVGAASLGQGALVYGVWHWGARQGLSHGAVAAAGWLLVTIAVGLLGFFALAMLLKVQEARRLVGWLFRRR